MRGRKPKPVELKLISGNPGRRPLPDAVPKVEGVPAAPPGLGAEELAEWRRLCAEMALAGTLSKDTGAVIEVHIRSLCRLRKAEAHLSEHGLLVPAPRTSLPMVNPHLRIAEAAAAMVLKTASELGLTPSARGRVSGVPKPKENKFRDLG